MRNLNDKFTPRPIKNFARDDRNNMNYNFEQLALFGTNAFLYSLRSLENAETALASAKRAENKIDNLQHQVDELVVNGDSSPAAAQAQVDLNGHTYPTLKDRIDGEQLKIDKSYVSIESFPREEGETDDDNRLKRAIAAAPENGRVQLAQGETYEIGNLFVEGKSVTITGNNARIKPVSNSNTLHFRGGWEELMPVTEVKEISYGFVGSGSGAPINALVVNNANSFRQGDVVRVVSDDVIVGARPGSNGRERRRAQFAIVGAVNENEIYLTSLLRETFSTNVRVAKLSKDQIIIENLIIEFNPIGLAEGWSNNTIVIEAAYQPIVRNVSCEGGYGSLVTFRGCYGYMADEIFGKDLINAPFSGNYGYGINDIGSEFGRVNACFFSDVRHGYTTNSDAIEKESAAIERYGSTANASVTMKVVGSSNSGADTHEEAYGITFNKTEVYNAYRGYDSSGAGFSLRGKMIVLNDCTADGCRYGVHVFEQFKEATNGIYLNNFRSLNTRGQAVLINVTGTGERLYNIEINGGLLECIRGNRLIEISNAEVVINRAQLVSKTSSSYCFGIYNTDAKVKTNKIIIDYQGTGTNPRAFRTEGNTDLTAIGDAILFRSLSSPAVIEDNGSGSVIIEELEADKTVTINVGVTNTLKFSTGNSFNGEYGYISQSLSTNADMTSKLEQSLHRHIYFLATPNSDSIGFNKIPPGQIMGQLLTIKNNSSSNKLVVRSGSAYGTELRKSQSVVLDPKDVITLMWQNSLWVSI